MIFMAVLKLQELGFTTIDEYDLPRKKGFTARELRRFANAAIAGSDIVCFIEGWEQNPSAVRERKLCTLWDKLAISYADLVQRNEEMLDFTPEVTL